MSIAAFARTCAKNVTGNLKFWIAELANVTTVTITSGEVSAITGTGAFKRIQADLDTLERSEKVEGGASGYKFTHEIKAHFSKPKTTFNTLIKSLEDASPCGMALIMLDSNNQAWLVGYNATDLKDRGLRLTSGTLDSGKAPGEDGKQGWDLVLGAVASEHALPFDSTQNAAILAESATYLSAS